MADRPIVALTLQQDIEIENVHRPADGNVSSCRYAEYLEPRGIGVARPSHLILGAQLLSIDSRWRVVHNGKRQNCPGVCNVRAAGTRTNSSTNLRPHGSRFMPKCPPTILALPLWFAALLAIAQPALLAEVSGQLPDPYRPATSRRERVIPSSCAVVPAAAGLSTARAGRTPRCPRRARDRGR